MKMNIEILDEPSTLVMLECNGYVIQLQMCDLDRAVHGGLNMLLPDGGYVPVPESFDGQSVFVIQNMTSKLRDGEIGWLILANNLSTAVSYASANSH